MVILTKATLRNEDHFKKQKISYRPQTTKGDTLFHTWINTQSWNEIKSIPHAEGKAAALMAKFDSAMNNFYPMMRETVKSTDGPWITPAIKRRIKTRKRTYDKETCPQG